MTDDAQTHRPPTLLDRIRGTANTVTLFGAIVFLLGWTLGAGRAPPTLMAMVGLVTFTAFLVSVVTIVVGNRRDAPEHEEDQTP